MGQPVMFSVRFSNRHFFSALVFTLGAAHALLGCSDDDQKSADSSDAGTGGASESGGTTGTGGVSSSGGRAGSSGGTTSTGGTSAASGGASETGGSIAATDGASASGGSASSDLDGGTTDGGNDGGDASDGSAAGNGAFTPRLVLAGVTDYTWASFASIDLKTGEVLQRWATVGSAIAVGRDGHGFVLERETGVLDTLATDGLFSKRIDLKGGLGDAGVALAYVNPHDVVPITGTNKAFVSINGANVIEVVDIAEGTVTGLVDLSQFLPAGQDRVSVDMGAYDPKTNRVYFALQRVDLKTYACAAYPALLIGIDAATNQLVDINGAGDGLAIPLHLKQPTSVALRGEKLYVLAIGCNDPNFNSEYRQQGIEVVDLAAGTSTPSYTTTEQNYAQGFSFLNDETAVVSRNSLDYLSVVWNTWDLGAATLGPSLNGAPAQAGAVETSDSLLGIDFNTLDAGVRIDVVRYGVSSGKKSLVAADPWALLDTAAGQAAAGLVVLE